MRTDPTAKTATPRMNLYEMLRDPLVHFLAIGLIIFVAVRLYAPVDVDEKRMVVDQSVYNELVEIFADTNERAPDTAEMNALVDRWVLNETLYREAISLGLQDGDEMIRERTMQKMRVLIQNAVIVDPPDTEALQAWFEERRASYDTPAKITFRIARVDGDAAAARAAAVQLNAAETASSFPGTVYPFNNRPRDGLVNVFGEGFVTTLEKVERGVWVPVDTANGWQAVRVERIEPAEPAEFSKIVSMIASDYEQEAARTASTRAVEALIAAYDVDVTDAYDPTSYAELIKTRFGKGAPEDLGPVALTE